MSEPQNNIRFRCDLHKSHPDPVYAEMPFDFFIGKYCKLSFPAPEGKHELMWVKVEKVEEIEGKMMLVGILDNDPTLVTNYKYGDGVGFEREEIHLVC